MVYNHRLLCFGAKSLFLESGLSKVKDLLSQSELRTAVYSGFEYLRYLYWNFATCVHISILS